MATASESDIAKAFLSQLGAPDSPAMEKAVIAWLRAESGSKIIGNNPWNISMGAASNLSVKPIGYRVHSVTGQKFAVYGSVTDGARASAELLKSGGGDWRGYGYVVLAARAGNPDAFLKGLAASAWDAGRYGTKNGGTNKLLSIYHGIGGLRTVSLTDAVTGGSAPAGTLGAWGNLISFPTGHKLTQADVDSIIATLDAAKMFDGIGHDQALAATRAVLTKHIGDAWDKTLQDTMQKELGDAANAANDNALTTLAGVAGTLINPANWIRILALLAGAAMAAYGSINVLRAAG